MTTIEGFYFNGEVPEAEPAIMVFSGASATLTLARTTEVFERNKLTVSPRIGMTDRFIVAPNGGQFVCPDDTFLDTLLQQGRSEGLVAWLEKRWWVALICVLIIVNVMLVGYYYGLPAAAERLSKRIPIETELVLGEKALDWLDSNNWFYPSQLETAEQDKILEGFKQLIENLPYKDFYQLEFRSSEFIGPNAFAFPGGIIVVTDDLVELAEATEEVLAVLAHEIGHVELRHAIQGIMQQSAVAIVVTAITADASTLSAAVTGVPMVLAQMKYSRKFEEAADDYGFDLLKQKGYSPAAFAAIMERMSTEEHPYSRIEYLSSHPLTDDRVQRAHDAAEE